MQVMRSPLPEWHSRPGVVCRGRSVSSFCVARPVTIHYIPLLAALSLVQHMGPDGYRIIVVWPGILAMLGFAIKHLTFSNRFLAYANEAVLPFYILHQNVLLWVGFFVVQWAVPDLIKYLIIMLSSFLVIMLLYEYLVRRVTAPRILFGLKPLKAIAGARVPSAPSVPEKA
jgi:hypothetical protein